MLTENKELSEAKVLREKAEQEVNNHPSKDLNLPEGDVAKLMHELEVHEIELEMQNEELRTALNEAHKATEKYTTLYDFAPVGYYTLNENGNIINLNLNGASMLNSVRHDLKGKNIRHFISPETLSIFQTFFDKVISTNIKQTCEVNLGSHFVHLEGIVSDIKDEYLITSIDLTELQNAKEALQELNEELLRSNKDLENFAYIASHDLQEPLRMVSSFTQLLQQKYANKLDKEANEFIQFAIDGAQRMYNLLNGLLAYSRVQTKGKPFSLIDLNHIIATVKQNLTIKIEEKKAVINTYKLPKVLADETQMIQLFQNLIDNAIKFSNDNPKISISYKPECDYNTFFVRDEGIGIEQQYFDRIFHIFQRLHQKEEYDGTGIGLAICKRIVERHKGKIWVESEPGMGSTFCFTISKTL